MTTAYHFVEPDARGRVGLGKWLKPGSQYLVESDPITGSVTLEPIGAVLSEEATADLLANPKRAAALIRRGQQVAVEGAEGNSIPVDDFFNAL